MTVPWLTIDELGDSRAPVGFLNSVTQHIRDLDGNAFNVSQRIALDRAQDAACTFAALEHLAYTGEIGLVMSRAYETTQIADRLLLPHLDDLFRTNSMYGWRSSVSPHSALCNYCHISPLSGTVCSHCNGSGRVTYKGMENDASLPLRAVRIAHATMQTIRKVVTNPHVVDIGSDMIDAYFDAGLIEAEAAGIPREKLEQMIATWRFQAVARREPYSNDEELFLAFQAAWDAGAFAFAKAMVTAAESVTPA